MIKSIEHYGRLEIQNFPMRNFVSLCGRVISSISPTKMSVTQRAFKKYNYCVIKINTVHWASEPSQIEGQNIIRFKKENNIIIGKENNALQNNG